MTKLFQPCHCERPTGASQSQSRQIAQSSNRTDNAITTQTSFARNDKRTAFTLAEVLITLAIIGVVAAMTIPTLVANYQQKSWDTASSVFNRRLGEALKVMNVNSNLAGFDSTQAFVDELGKHIKITRTCASDKLTDCFVETITTDGDPIDTTKLKKAKNLNSVNDYGTETIGVQFADGVSALIAYNPKTTQDPYSNQIVQLTQSEGKSVGLCTSALSVLYDVSGSKTPNSFGTNKDIRGLNINIKTGADIQVVSNVTPIDCSDSSAEDHKYCVLGSSADNFWAGAKKACADLGMNLPLTGGITGETCPANAAENTLCGIYNNRDEYGITSGYFWTASGEGANATPYVDFSNGRVYDHGPKINANSALCIAN